MNRRQFFASSASVAVLAANLNRAVAQDPPNLEPRWDEASGMYGNAWDLLPVAEEGTAELLGVSFEPYGFTDAVYSFGIVHNNTEDDLVLVNVIDDSGDEYSLDTPTYNQVIVPGAYAQYQATNHNNDGAYENGLPTLVPEFWSPEDLPEEYRTRNLRNPLQIDALEYLGGDEHLLTITNTSDLDIDGEEYRANVSILFFDETGTAISGSTSFTFLMRMEYPIPAGASAEIRLEHLFYEIDPETPYLLSAWYV